MSETVPTTVARTRTVEWQDPAPALAAAPGMTGLEFMRAVWAGEVPPPPISALLRMQGTNAAEGTVTFRCDPDESMLNPLGTVHGGVICTVLDSAIGCAVHTTLPAGVTYTSIDLNVSYLRSPKPGAVLEAVGTVTKPGRRVAFGAAELRDDEGRLIATATGSCLVMDLRG